MSVQFTRAFFTMDWEHDKFQEAPVSSNPSKVLLVTNLHYSIGREELADLFPTASKYFVKYDKSGRSLGSAEIIFASENEAEAAMKTQDARDVAGMTISIAFTERARRKRSRDDNSDQSRLMGRLGPKRGIESRLGSRLDDRLGQRIGDRLGKKVQPKQSGKKFNTEKLGIDVDKVYCSSYTDGPNSPQIDNVSRCRPSRRHSYLEAII